MTSGIFQISQASVRSLDKNIDYNMIVIKVFITKSTKNKKDVTC